MIQLRNDALTNDPRLDRIPHKDPRSVNYPVRTLFGAPAAEIPLRSYTWRVGTHLDQGREGACVGFGFSHELAAKPTVISDVTDDFARRVYFNAQRADSWEGGAYPGASPFYEGTAVDAGAEVLRKAGYYSEYRWAHTEREMAVTVGYKGPVVIGVNWYTGMFNPNSGGLLEVTGQIEGGHCILVYGINVKRGVYKLWNSWGPDWGVADKPYADGGVAFISRGDMARLITENGDVCLPLRNRKHRTIANMLDS